MRCRRCWASLFGDRVVSYRLSQGIDAEPALAVVVQQMVDSERSGVMFTADPSTADATKVVIEAAFGLGEVVVGGAVEPDTYVVDKDGPRLRSVRVGNKTVAIVRGADGKDSRVELSDEQAARRVLTDDEVIELARTGLRIHDHYGEPQDIEWAVAEGRLVHPPDPSDHDAHRDGGPSASPQCRRQRRAHRCCSRGSRRLARASSPASCGSSRRPRRAATCRPARSSSPR